MLDRATQVVADVDAWIGGRRWTRVIRGVVFGFLDHDALRFAGSMAYFAILSLFQVIVLGIVVLTFFLDEGRVRDLVVEWITDIAPINPETIIAVIDATIASRGGMTLISIGFLIWGSLGLFGSISEGISRVFDSAPRRGFVSQQLIGLLLMGVVGAMVLASLLIGLVTGIVERLADRVEAPALGDLATWALTTLLPILLVFGAFWIIYRVVPTRRVGWGHALLGAIAATFLWTVLRAGFTWYATRIADYESVWGPISTAITMLVFLYFGSVVVLIGAEFMRAIALDEEADQPAEG
ncbi:MAG TPA: YihY/virulence factor BrkB family protein [Candidatus Limnocylindria bacterium]|jgi:membrane protein